MPDDTTRPIIFSAPMVRALLAGRKSQTRRLLSPNNFRLFSRDRGLFQPTARLLADAFREASPIGSPCPGSFVWRARAFDHQRPATETHWQGATMVQPGQRLWVRENWRCHERPEDGLDGVLFQADGAFRPIANTEAASEAWHAAAHTAKGARRRGEDWRPCIHMPRWASRLTLAVTAVRVQRLQDITLTDMEAEGIVPDGHPGMEAAEALRRWTDLWNSLHGKPGTTWRDDPHVIALTFTVTQGNIDA